MSDFTTFYLKDLMPMIDAITLDMVKHSTPDSMYPEMFSPLQVRLDSIFEFADKMKKAIKGDEDDDG